MRRPGERGAAGGSLLVGDAAGLVDPLTGDGMYEAFVRRGSPPERVLAGELDGTSRRSTGRSRASSRPRGRRSRARPVPAADFALARLPPVWGVVGALLRGELAQPGEARGLARSPLALVAALGRLKAPPQLPISPAMDLNALLCAPSSSARATST